MRSQSRMSEQVISMSNQGKFLVMAIAFCITVMHGWSQPLPLEAFHFGEIPLLPHLQNVSRLGDLCITKDGRMYATNGRYLIEKKGSRLEAIAGQGIGGVEGGVNSVFLDEADHIWISGDYTVHRLEDKTNQFVEHKIVAEGDTLLPGRWKVATLRENLLIISPKKIIFSYNPETGQCIPLVKFPKDSPTPQRLISLDKKQVLIATGNKLFILNEKQQVTPVATLSENNELQSATLLFKEWLYVWSRPATLYRIHLPTGKQKVYAIGNPVVRRLSQILVSGKRYAVLGGPDSLYFFEPINETRFSWHSSIRQTGAKYFPKTESIVQDDYGRVWLNNGQSIFWFDVPKVGFSVAFTHLDKLSNITTGNFQEPSFIGASKYQPIVLYTADKFIYVYDTVSQKIRQQASLPVGNELSFKSITEISPNEWIACAIQGLFKYNLAKNTFTPITYKGAPIIRPYCEITSDSMVIIDQNYKMYKGPLLSPDKLRPLTILPDSLIFEMHKGYGQQLLAITPKGLMQQKNPLAEWTLFTSLQSLKYINYTDIKIILHPLKKQIILFGTGKLWLISAENGKIIATIPLIRTGLPFALRQVYPLDQDHILLVQVNQAFTILNVSTLNFYSIGIRQGWWGHYMGTLTYVTPGQNNDWWATFDGGLVHFTTNQLLQKPLPPPAPEIHQIQIQYTNHNMPASRYKDSPLEVSYQKGAVSYLLSGIEADSVEYCLPPFDDTWRRGTAATFTNLPGGLYSLKVREAGAGGSHSPETVTMLRILPPFWKTLWFRIMASLAMAGTIYLFFRLRLKQQNDKNTQQLQLAQSELKAIRSQMNPHFIFNCMTAIDALISTGQSQKASVYLAKFSKLVRQVLQLSEKQLISLADEINTLKLYLQLEQLRMQDAFDFTFDIAEGLEEMIEIPPMLLQPFVENAIIHGLKPSLKPQKQIRVSAGKEAGKIMFNIEDNGVGRRPGNINPGKHHTSMGIKLTGERLKMMEQVLPMKTNYFYTDMFDDGGMPSGTKVTIELTYQN